MILLDEAAGQTSVSQKLGDSLEFSKKSFESFYDRVERMFSKIVKAVDGIPYPIAAIKQFAFEDGRFAAMPGSPLVYLQVQLPKPYDDLNKELGGIKLGRSIIDPIEGQGLGCSIDKSNGMAAYFKNDPTLILVRIVDK